MDKEMNRVQDEIVKGLGTDCMALGVGEAQWTTPNEALYRYQLYPRVLIQARIDSGFHSSIAKLISQVPSCRSRINTPWKTVPPGMLN